MSTPATHADSLKPILFDRLSAGDHDAWKLLAIVFFGVIVFYLFSLSREFQGTTVALRKMFPKWSDSSITRLDFFVVITLGTGVAALLFNPSSSFEAMMAGLGWVGALNTLSGVSVVPPDHARTTSPHGEKGSGGMKV